MEQSDRKSWSTSWLFHLSIFLILAAECFMACRDVINTVNMNGSNSWDLGSPTFTSKTTTESNLLIFSPSPFIESTLFQILRTKPNDIRYLILSVTILANFQFGIVLYQFSICPGYYHRDCIGFNELPTCPFQVYCK